MAAATAIADVEGLDAVSIRRVASEMGVRAMSLYTYIDRKEDLLALMGDMVTGEILLGEDLPAGWRAGLEAISRSTRDALMRHSWYVSLSSRIGHAEPGPNALRHVEESLTVLRDLGLAPSDTIAVLMAVDKYVLGHAIFEVTNHDAAADTAMAQPYVADLLSTGEFPELSRMLPDGLSYESGFERGLAWLLDGIEADLTTRRGT